jgi:hypothetical protein
MTLAGCTTPVIVASAAVPAFQYGTEAFVRGDLESAQIATMEDVYDATERVIADLEFFVSKRHFGKNTAWIKCREIGGRAITIDFERRSNKVTKTTIRVGVWGDQAISRLLLAEIQARLPAVPAPRP